jgi:hypothetical protein
VSGEVSGGEPEWDWDSTIVRRVEEDERIDRVKTSWCNTVVSCTVSNMASTCLVGVLAGWRRPLCFPSPGPLPPSPHAPPRLTLRSHPHRALHLIHRTPAPRPALPITSALPHPLAPSQLLNPRRQHERHQAREEVSSVLTGGSAGAVQAVRVSGRLVFVVRCSLSSNAGAGEGDRQVCSDVRVSMHCKRMHCGARGRSERWEREVVWVDYMTRWGRRTLVASWELAHRPTCVQNNTDCIAAAPSTWIPQADCPNPPSSPPSPLAPTTRPPRASTPTTRSGRHSRPSRSTPRARSSSTTLWTSSRSCVRVQVHLRDRS